MTTDERGTVDSGQWPVASGRLSAVGRRPSLVLAAILTAFLLLGFAYSAFIPLLEATDELRHYRFIQHLIQRHALPVQGETSDLACTIQGHHPPLFYATAALLTFWIDTGRDICHEPPTNPFWAYRYWEVGRDNKNQYLHGPDEAFPWRGEALAAHLARLVNLLFGALTVWLTWATARLIWPGRPALAAGSAAFVAFNPMFLYMAAAINNDVAAAAAGAAVTYACVRLLLDERGLRWQWGVALGALYGLALLSKFNLAAILVVIEAAVTWVAWRRRQWRQWLVVNAVVPAQPAALRRADGHPGTDPAVGRARPAAELRAGRLRAALRLDEPVGALRLWADPATAGHLRRLVRCAVAVCRRLPVRPGAALAGDG